MMASTMTIPQVAAFHGPIPRPIHGAMPGSVPTAAMQGNYAAGHVPVSLQGPVNVMPGPIPTSNNSPATISPPVQALRLPVVPVGGGCYNDGMEVVWHGEFSRLFSSFFPPHVWYLSITNSAPQEKWKFYRDSAKVRFCCQDCGNGWTSMKGRVTFWFHLNAATSEGFVQFKLYGQVCKKCNSGKFEYVMWYPEEVSKVMCNLYNKVGQTFYGFMQPPIRIDRRPGRPRNQHNAELCQACRDGECDQGRPVKALYNYMQSPINLRAPNQAIPGRPPFPPTSLGPVNQMPVVISQQPMHHAGQLIMQSPLNSTPPHSCASFITAPVTLTSGIQPILTYSIVTGQTKEAAKLTPVPEDETKSEDSSQATANGDTTPPTPSTVSDGTAKSVPIDAVAAKLASINIKSPLTNGVASMKNGRAPNLSMTKPVYNGTTTIKAPLSSNAKNSPKKVSPLIEATTNGQSEKKAEMKQPQSPIANGYSTAVTGKSVLKAQTVNGVDNK
uniref:uncharacterized protein LOC120326802 n=1 Tax=Styela clava TaxID=7725 RepID=UPI001939F20C|nr:uncharacterized protein LOC120326802 [Styela clava]